MHVSGVEFCVHRFKALIFINVDSAKPVQTVRGHSKSCLFLAPSYQIVTSVSVLLYEKWIPLPHQMSRRHVQDYSSHQQPC
jgi:hypothetical protein